MSKDNPIAGKTGRSLWNAPAGAKSESLAGVELQAPDAREAQRIIEEVKHSVNERVRAYRTPVTEKTFRRKLR
jgi:hypothetical protein